MKGSSQGEHEGARPPSSPRGGLLWPRNSHSLSTPSDPVIVPRGHLPAQRSEEVGKQYVLLHGGPISTALFPGPPAEGVGVGHHG